MRRGDPFANFTMGRSYWLESDLETSLVWLDRATTLNPNYAHGIYARAWAQTISGHGKQGLANVDTAWSLSPLDPLAYAMLGTRALAHVVLGEYTRAAEFGESAARSPGAHVLIAMIAALGHLLAGDPVAAARWARNVRQRRSDLSAADFLHAFPFTERALRRRVCAALAQLDF